jgi:hypothetical protein
MPNESWNLHGDKSDFRDWSRSQQSKVVYDCFCSNLAHPQQYDNEITLPKRRPQSQLTPSPNILNFLTWYI